MKAWLVFVLTFSSADHMSDVKVLHSTEVASMESCQKVVAAIREANVNKGYDSALDVRCVR